MCPEQMLLSWLLDPLDSAREFKVIPFKTSGGGNLGEGISCWSPGESWEGGTGNVCATPFWFVSK